MRWKAFTFMGLAALLALPAVVSAHRADVAGAVYTMTNAADGNEILIFDRSAGGRLKWSDSVSTGGLGTGSGLGNQGAVILDRDNRWLFAVNAGSNEISVFRVLKRGLALVDTVASGGIRPVSLTVDRDLLYVLNAGSDEISGFSIGHHGRLTPIADSTRPLSGTGTGPAQVEFSPNGRVLVVTEKATNKIDTYVVGRDGLATGPQVYDSEGPTPFGFAFGKRGVLIVSEAAGGAPDAGSMSSYLVSRQGELEAVSPAVDTTETAACWVVITKDGRFAYTTNAGSGTISGYSVGHDGSIQLLDADGVTGVTGQGSAPIDMALSQNGRYLYTLNSGTQTIGLFRVRMDGSLKDIGQVQGLPSGANGLAAR